MAQHRIHDHYQNLAYHFPESSHGNTPALVRASSLSVEGGLRQVSVLLFCAVRFFRLSALTRSHAPSLPLLPRVQAWDDNWEGIYALSEVIMQNTISKYMAS